MAIQVELFLQRQIVLLLEGQGWLVIQNAQKKGAGVHESFGFKKGVPDLTVIKEGRVIFLELKSERIHKDKLRRGVLSEDQKTMIRKLEAHKVEVYVVYNVYQVIQICCLTS